MVRIFIFSFFIFFSLLFNYFVELPLHANELGWLKVVGNKIQNSKGENILLKGVFIPDPEHLNTKKWKKKKISAEFLIKKAVLEYGAKVIRVPVLPESDGYTGFFLDPDRYIKKHLLPVVDLCKKLNVYIIIDLHYISDYLGKRDDVLKFWKIVAPKLKNFKHVIFELYNEPIYPDNWSVWKDKIALPAINQIRESAKNNIIIVSAPYWTSHLKGILSDPINKKNIVYAAHIYPNQLKKGDWAKTYELVLKRFPLFITEWGYDNNSKDPVLQGTTSGYGKTFLSWMNKHQLSRTACIFDHNWDPPMFNSDWSLTGGKNQMGKLVSDDLKSAN